jgi:hypothetical protein
MSAAPRIDWSLVIPAAASIVRSYDTNVTLRQLHYRLVSDPSLGYPNTTNAYKSLSSKTAELRRLGEFPRLHDRTRSVHRPDYFEDCADVLEVVVHSYRRDRTIGQAVNLFIAVEKNGLIEQLRSWFYGYGVGVLALGGYASQGLVDDVVDRIVYDGRPAVLLYAGDFDPSGEDIDRAFVKSVGLFARVHRVALSARQVEEFDLPPNPGKSGDSRAGQFVERHGELVQVEVDALPPDVLRGLFVDRFLAYWNRDAYEQVQAAEAEDRETLRAIAAGWRK